MESWTCGVSGNPREKFKLTSSQDTCGMGNGVSQCYVTKYSRDENDQAPSDST